MSYLVIQGRRITGDEAQTLATLAGAARSEPIGAGGLRLYDPETPDRAAGYCAGAKLDFAFVPAPRRLADFGLLVMDMDSTLISIETVDEMADLVGRKAEVAAITAQAMRGEIEYDESLRRRVAVLKGLEETAIARLYEERVKLSPGAEELLAGAKRAGLKILLVSGGFTHVTDRLKTRLGLDYTRSNTLAVKAGRLTGKIEGRIVNAEVKREALLAVRDELGLAREEVIAIGDGANDLAMLAEAGVSIAWRAKPVVREKTTYCFDYVGLDGLLNLYA